MAMVEGKLTNGNSDNDHFEKFNLRRESPVLKNGLEKKLQLFLKKTSDL